jgi:hypothetical protein
MEKIDHHFLGNHPILAPIAKSHLETLSSEHGTYSAMNQRD